METYRITEDGFQLVAGLVDRATQLALIEAVGDVDAAGRRNMLATAAVAELAGSRRLLELVHSHTGGVPRAVRAIWFNKSPEANWLVTWHQDLAIAVRERIETPGFGGWSVKDGVPHVQPPAAVLERMLAVRIHLDDADEANGALRVLRGTHTLGRLDPDRVTILRSERDEVLCGAHAGDALLMRPLLLHASGRSQNQRPRRVLHLEYAAEELPGGLKWRDEGI